MSSDEILMLIDKAEQDSHGCLLTKRHVQHPNVVAIREQGESVVPHLIQCLRQQDSWTVLLLLSMIVKPLPVRPENSGKYKLILQDWLAWADSCGF
jgi:hypothetical protein